jgi:hypothetical protein
MMQQFALYEARRMDRARAEAALHLEREALRSRKTARPFLFTRLWNWLTVSGSTPGDARSRKRSSRRVPLAS